MRKTLVVAWTSLLIVACSERGTPTQPGSVSPEALLRDQTHSQSAPSASAHHSNRKVAEKEDKGLIDGWFEGRTLELYYTKTYYCANPPSSGAPSGCEIGADAEAPPRGGPIPTIYAIAAAGITPDPTTLACQAGSACLNHPLMLDASRILGPGATSVLPLAHSHIVGERRSGWFHTVNIRVFDLGVWNQIAAAKNIDKVRELQMNPAIGVPGKISADTLTNIYFFIASWRKE